MRRVSSFLAILCATLWLAQPAQAQAAGFDTPEAAISAYIEAVAAQDFDAILATTAIDRLEGTDVAGSLERMQMLTPATMLPASSPFFDQINQATFAGNLGSQVKMLTYSLLFPVPEDFLDRGIMQLDAEGLAAFLDALEAGRLAGLDVVLTIDADPEQAGSAAFVDLYAMLAVERGAEEVTEQVAILSLEDRFYMIGFGLSRYEDGWLIFRQDSPVSRLPMSGVAVRVDPEALAAFMQ